MPMFVNIALNIPADKLFTYEVPSDLQEQIAIGKRVFVSFGRRKRTGFIIAISSSCPLEKVKFISEVLDEEPLFSENDLRFYQWIADYFIYPLGKALAEIIPAGSEKKDFLWVTPLPLIKKLSLTPAQNKLLNTLQQYPRGIAAKALARISGLKNISAVMCGLQLAGLLQIDEKQKKQLALRREKVAILNSSKIPAAKLTRKQEELIAFIQERGTMPLSDLIEQSGTSSAIIKRLQAKGIIELSEAEKIRTPVLKSVNGENETNFILNSRQQKAFQEICAHLEKNIFTPILLHGVTGSGKTEVYLNAIARVMENGGSAIYLVPEIALTPQLISRILWRFDQEQIAIMHSGIAEPIRYDQWRQIKRGQIKLVIGARSALFAPLPDLKLIIVDEEHDASYKQDDRLCYHGRDLAVLKAKLDQAVVVLGSATPGIRSYYNARNKKYHYLEISQRVENKPLPEVEIVDMKAQLEEQGKAPILSAALIAAIETTLARKEQVLLFLNKRGFDTFLICADCGYNFRCPNCAVSLKHHAAESVIKCHYCDYTQKALPVCPTCHGSRILSYGAGTQKLEAEIKILFPDFRIARMDSDTTKTRGAQEKILQKLGQREIDVLVGTQMITKGHDFPFITLVGVISADTSLNMPDFRAGERTFQQLTQVAGRGGRGSTPGRVILQTFNPEHYALKHVRNHDYKSFYAEEIVFRKEFKYPPFGRLINLRLSAAKKEILCDQAQQIGKMAKRLSAQSGNDVEIIGPAESPVAKIKGRYRWQMLLKSENGQALHRMARELVHAAGKSTVKITVDVDPENFM
jgi:primosomal protein N' (replication factor Y) (superfamily II helicase)